MLTKVKRVKRKKYAVGDEARKFENIPTASQPQQQKLGTRQEYLDKYATSQIKAPELADAAKQSYTQQAVQSNELLAGTQQAATTPVGTTTITGQTIATPTSLTAAQAATPTTPTTSTMTAGTGTAQTGTAQAGTVGTPSQIGTVTGTLSGTATGATATPTSSAVAAAQQGQLSSLGASESTLVSYLSQ